MRELTLPSKLFVCNPRSQVPALSSTCNFFSPWFLERQFRKRKTIIKIKQHLYHHPFEFPPEVHGHL